MTLGTAGHGAGLKNQRVMRQPSFQHYCWTRVRSCLAIENMIPDPGGSDTLSFPGFFDASTVVEQRTTGWIRRWINEQFSGDCTCRYPPVSIPRPVAFAITPPRKLARWLFAALIDDGAGRARKMAAPRAVEYGPADGDHTDATLPSCFPIKSKRKTMVFDFQALGTTVARKK